MVWVLVVVWNQFVCTGTQPVASKASSLVGEWETPDLLQPNPFTELGDANRAFPLDC
jgi:hypothetical protein